MNSSSPERVQALLRLLSDPNEQIARKIQDELINMGPDILSQIESARAKDPSLPNRLEWVIDEIHFQQLRRRFQRLMEEQPDWEEGAFLIAQLEAPTLEMQPYRTTLDRFAQEFQVQWNLSSPPAEETARHLAGFLFKDKGFSGNRDQYYDPNNSFLHHVLDRRRGIPITLSAIFVFVATRLNLPVAGIGMPTHFLAGTPGKESWQFIDGFNEGMVLTEKDCRKWIAAGGLEFQPQHLAPTPIPAILARMLRNLLHIYEETDHFTMAKRVKTLLDCIPGHAQP